MQVVASKTHLKRGALLVASYASGFFRSLSKPFFANEERIYILMYHGITSEENKGEIRNILECNIPQSVFETQMHYLSQHCNVISLQDAILRRNIKAGVTNVVITFDDGYRNNYIRAYPILRRYGFSAVFALTTGFVLDRNPLYNDILEWMINHTAKKICGVKYKDGFHEFNIELEREKIIFYKWAFGRIVGGEQTYRETFIANIAKALNVEVDRESFLSEADYEPLTQDEVRRMVHEGLIEFAAHSNSHCNLTEADGDQLREEVLDSKRKVESLTSRSCSTFCVPAGCYDDRSLRAIQEAGFQTILTSDKFSFESRSPEAHVLLGRNCVMVMHNKLPIFADMVNGFVQNNYHKIMARIRSIKKKRDCANIQKNTTRNIFSNMAHTGKWEASYSNNKADHASYNFITRRDSVRSLIQDDRFEMTLDLGCGTGDYVPLLSDRSTSYVGVDYIPDMAMRAHRRFGGNRQNVNFITADVSRSPFQSESFDCVLAIGLIEYFKDPDSVLKEICRILKDGGIVVIQSYQMDFFWLCAYWSGYIQCRKMLVRIYHKLMGKRKLFPVDRPYRKQQLDQLLMKHGFDIIDYRFDNFFLFPHTLARIFPNFYIKVSEAINKTSKFFSLFAVNYVGKYKYRKVATNYGFDNPLRIIS